MPYIIDLAGDSHALSQATFSYPTPQFRLHVGGLYRQCEAWLQLLRDTLDSETETHFGTTIHGSVEGDEAVEASASIQNN